MKTAAIVFFRHIGKNVISYLLQIVQLLDDKDSYIRSQVLQLLQYHKGESKRHIDKISALLNDTSYTNQTMAAHVLVAMGPEGVNRVLNHFPELFKRTPRNKGCNECSGQINAIVGDDTLLIIGEPHGQKIECKGNNYDLKNNTMHCKPFEMNKMYELKGNLEYSGKDNTIKVFKVIDYKIIIDE
ncbi:MAG: HEAT repeat domain-containing protein [Chitinispirillaceae bacterium]|nr:HEAT repeat domain-containing protein [Chitinispirillaceae bacterium]